MIPNGCCYCDGLGLGITTLFWPHDLLIVSKSKAKRGSVWEQHTVGELGQDNVLFFWHSFREVSPYVSNKALVYNQAGETIIRRCRRYPQLHPTKIADLLMIGFSSIHIAS